MTALLLLEAVPSAVAALLRARMGLDRLEDLTRLGLREGRRLWVLTLVGVLHTLAVAGVVAGLWWPGWGIAGAAVEAGVFSWVLTRQAALGQRGRDLTAYTIFLAMALAVLVVDTIRV